MTDTTTINRTRWRAHARDAFKPVPNSRFYALDDAALDALAAFASEWQQDRASRDITFELSSLKQVFGELSKHVPTMVQHKPGDAPPTPKLWTDPVSGQPANNPYADDPKDVSSIAVLEMHDPLLAAHLKRTANGASYSYLHELQQAEAKRARLADIKYGSMEHEKNPFRDKSASGLTAQSQLLALDRELAAFYKVEAEPLTLPWQPGFKNMTSMSLLSLADPLLGRLARQAEQLLEQWTKDELSAARQAEEQARAQRIAAEQRLGAKAT